VQPERQVSVALVSTSAAVLLPVFSRLFREPTYEPGAALLVGTVIGAAGTFLGGALASQDTTLPWRLFLSFWTVLALALSVGALFGLLAAHAWAWKGAFALSAFLPLASVGVFWWPRKK
jgi:hypothetical protein